MKEASGVSRLRLEVQEQIPDGGMAQNGRSRGCGRRKEAASRAGGAAEEKRAEQEVEEKRAEREAEEKRAKRVVEERRTKREAKERKAAMEL